MDLNTRQKLEENKKIAKSMGIGCLVIIFILGFVILLGNLISPTDKTTTQKQPQSNQANEVAEAKITSENSEDPSLKEEEELLSMQEASVLKVIDGDTIELSDGRVVRYIGIDTPETVDQRQGVQCFGEEASNKNKELLYGKKVRLEKDVSETDKYGRLLRYVYVDDLFVNEYLVREGYAYAVSYPPDIKYQQQLNQAQSEAREKNKGLWSACNNKTATPTTKQIVTPKPTSSLTPKTKPNSGGFTCGSKTKCGEMTSCEEAYFYLNSCGLQRLDADKDGVPCETLCR